MQTEAREVQMQELVEGVQDAMRRVDRLVREFSVYSLEQRTGRYLQRNGFSGERATRAIAEVALERKRLAAVNDEPGDSDR